MSERTLKISLAVLAPVRLSAGIAAITMYFDVRDLKAKVAGQVAAADIEKMRGELKAHEVRAEEKARHFENEIADLKEGQRALWRVRGRPDG
jgi:hypothetical protein